MEQRTDEQRAYNRERYKEWRSKNKEADEQIKLRYYARRIFDLSADELAALLAPRKSGK